MLRTVLLWGRYVTGLLDVGTVVLPPFVDEKTMPFESVEMGEAEEGVEAGARVVDVVTAGGVVEGMMLVEPLP